MAFPCALHIFRVLIFHWKIATQSASTKLLEADWGAERK
eukprot:COSAG02_NODE_53179_length_303_cov_1.004902_1_plen_38_part_01